MLLSALLLRASVTLAAVIAHDAVVGFPETVPSGNSGVLYLQYKPHLKIVNGCVPFPAVNANGDVSGGLNPSGGSNSCCSSSTGQVYARGTTYNGRYAIMYAWYMPKDSPSSGLGHRHDWESVVVWLSAASTSATLIGVAASAHGDFDFTTAPNLSGTSPLIRYYSTYPINHQLGFTSDVGGLQPLIAWESLTTAARAGLQDTNWGSANLPLGDANFSNNLAEAFS